MTEKLDAYRERAETLRQSGVMQDEVVGLVEELLAEMAELDRSNKALRRAALKAGQGSSMSTRLREALYE